MPGGDIALDVLHHDDRVIHHDAHRQHQAEQRQVVQRDAERIEDRERAHQRDRDRDHRNDRGPPGLQEHEHHADDEQDGDEDRRDHLVHRLGHEDGRVIDDDRIEAGRELRLQLLHSPEDGFFHGERVGAGLREDQQRHPLLLIHVGRGPVVRRADFNPADVADAGRPSLRVGLQDDVGELLRRGQATQRLHVELVRGAALHRRLVEHTSRDLDVLRPQGRQHLAGIEAVRRHLVGIQPDPHRIVARPEQLHVAHARQPRQRILHMQGRVVGEVQVVARPVRRIKVHGEQDVRRRLAHLHAQPLHVLRQPRQRVLHPVLRQHLRDVEVRADRERNGDGDLAVPGGLAAHVDHVLDAVDLLLERRRDRLAHHLGGGAGVARRHLHRRRHDLRVLRDRQDHQRAQADQGDEDAEHRRQDRAIDEGVREAHRVLLIV